MAHASSLRELYLARLREFYRQPARIFWVYGFPTILAVLLGLAFRSRPQESIKVVAVKNEASAGLERTLLASPAKPTPGRPRIDLEFMAKEQALKLLKSGKATIVIEPTTSGRPIYHFDPTQPEATAARAAFDDAYQRARGRADVFAADDELITEPGARYIDRLIPGLIGINTMGGGLFGVGFLIVHFRIAKLLKRFMATPMPRRDFLMAVLGARMTFLVPDVGVLLALGVFMFHMPIRGNLALFMLVELVGALAFSGIGLLVACRASSTETVSGLMNLVMIPMWLFSGVFFSSGNFPAPFQPFIQALPLTQLVWALRAILLEEAGFMDVVPAMLILSTWAVGTFALALRLFRWT